MGKNFNFIVVFFLGSAMSFAFNGITEPIEQAKIGFTVSGQIDSIWVKEGAFVHKGDTLMNLIKNEEEIRSQMTKLVADDLSSIASAKAKMDNYEKDFSALKKLYETSNSVSEEQLWERQMNYDMAKAEWEAAKVNKSKDTLEHNLANAELSKLFLIAPFDGEIVTIKKNKSESVEALSPIVEIADVRTCRLTAYIVADDARKLKKRQQVKLQLDGADKSRTKTGTIEYISPVVDKSSMLRTVKVIFNNRDRSVEPGVTGKILLE